MSNENNPVVNKQLSSADYKRGIAQAQAKLVALKQQIASFNAIVEDFGGLDKMRYILTTANANSQAMAANAKRENREKNVLINQLVANARCAFKRNDLEKFDINVLDKLVLSLQPLDYSARTFQANRQPDSGQKLVSLKELNAKKQKVT